MIQKIIQSLESAGANCYYVGGYVRDKLLGIESKDIDIEVFNMPFNELLSHLKKFGSVDVVGESFGVIKLHADQTYDFSIPRTENCTGAKHTDFEVNCNPYLSVKEAMERRDFTINAAYMDSSGDIVDYHESQRDISYRVLHPVSDKFREDALRPLRGFRFAGKMNMSVTQLTIDYSKAMYSSYNSLSKERVWEEWKRWAFGKHLFNSLLYLRDIEWIEHYPQIANLDGLEQDPAFHQEGWGCKLSFIPYNSTITSSTSTDSVDNGISFREFISSSITNNTAIKNGRSTPKTFSIIANTFNNTFPTSNTGVFGIDFSSIFSKTSVTETSPFMFFTRRRTSDTDKVFRVMFKIPLSRVHTHMVMSSHDREIIDRIISPISIYMMNLFLSKKSSSDMFFHNISMEPNATTTFDANLHIFIDIVDFTCEIIDSDVIFTIDCCCNNVFWNNFINPYFVDKNVSYDIIHSIPVFSIQIGDAFTHTGLVLDNMAELVKDLPEEDKLVLIFTALCHDMGKVNTTERIYKEKYGREVITSYNHANTGVPIAKEFLNSIGCPKHIIEKVLPLVREHMIFDKLKDKSIRKLAHRLFPANIRLLGYILKADALGKIPVKDLEVPNYIIERAKELDCYESSPKKLIQGEDLLNMGYTPGPIFGAILKELYHKQLNGAFHTKKDGLKMVQSTIESLTPCQ